MGKCKIIIAAAIALAMTACTDTNSAEVSDPPEVTTSNEVTTEETTTAVETTTTTAATATTTAYTEITTTADTAAEETVTEPEKSSEMKFFDYKFIENYGGTTDIGDLADKATAFIIESEYYEEAMKNTDSFSLENLKNFYSEEYAEKFAEYFDNSGNIVPKLNTAYPEDYDGDGKTETFIIIDMPYVITEAAPAVQSFLVFADSGGNMNILSNASGLYDTILLDYGEFKQITFGGAGQLGADDNTVLYGVADGKATELLSGRVNFVKEDCFLSTLGWQGMGDFMYYDTVVREYRIIKGVDMKIDDIRVMDTENSLADIISSLMGCQLIGGKYYCFIRDVMDEGTIYTYDNGRFTLVEGSNVRLSSNLCELEEVVDFDIEQALANMKPVQ